METYLSLQSRLIFVVMKSNEGGGGVLEGTDGASIIVSISAPDGGAEGGEGRGAFQGVLANIVGGLD